MGLAEMDSRNWTSLIDDIVAGDFYDAEAGNKVSVPYDSIVFEQSLDGLEETLVAKLKLGEKLAVVADENTYDVCHSPYRIVPNCCRPMVRAQISATLCTPSRQNFCRVGVMQISWISAFCGI